MFESGSDGGFSAVSEGRGWCVMWVKGKPELVFGGYRKRKVGRKRERIVVAFLDGGRREVELGEGRTLYVSPRVALEGEVRRICNDVVRGTNLFDVWHCVRMLVELRKVKSRLESKGLLD